MTLSDEVGPVVAPGADRTALAQASHKAGVAEPRPSGIAPTATTCKVNFIVVARHDDRLVGVARCLTDNSDVYVQDVAISPEHQHLGIGEVLLAEIADRGPGAELVLLAPAALKAVQEGSPLSPERAT